MRFASYILTGAAACGIIGFIPAAQAQTSAPAQDEVADIVVTGIRASLQSAQNIKRNSDKIVDSIVAEDIGKLPDINVAEALQRVSGIQVSRDRGEGGGVAIRGLSQVLTTMNGREVFTAGGGRSFNLQDVPSELLSGIDVYKTPSADLIEGGIGGVIDLRTRKPLDKKGFTFSASARGRYSDLADDVKPMASVLVSNSWDTDAGEFGILVSAAYQERAFATDIINVGAPNGRSDIIAGQTVNTPNGSYQPAIKGNRRRIGVDGIVQADSGLMSLIGLEGAEPCKVQAPIVDVMTGYVAVMAVLAKAIGSYGAPEHIRSDNGPEFIARTVRDGPSVRNTILAGTCSESPNRFAA